MSSGGKFWYHKNDSAESSLIINLPGKGRFGSNAIGHFNRDHSSAGIGQNLDTRCLHQNPDSFYEVRIWFRREIDGVSQECDRFSHDDVKECPEFTIENWIYEDPVSKEDLEKKLWSSDGEKVMTNEPHDYELVSICCMICVLVTAFATKKDDLYGTNQYCIDRFMESSNSATV